MSAAFTKMARRLHRRLGRYLDSHGPRHHHHAGALVAPHADESEAYTSLMAGLELQDPIAPLFMLEVFLSADEHVTAPAFSQLLKDRGHEIPAEKAAAALELFTSLGFAEKHFAEDGRVLYEHTRPGRHHDHIICGGCGRTTEFNRPDVDSLIEKIACEEEYCHLNHRLVIHGLCPECRRRRADGIPLAETTVGETVVVVGFNGSDELKQRLGDLGVHRGTRLKILGEQSGSVIALMEGCRLAMSSEMSAGIMVRATGHGHCGNRRLKIVRP